MTISAPPLSEKAWQQTVVDAATLYRWASYHTFDSRRSNPGWPDLVLCRPPELLVVELKTNRGRVSGVQREWLDRLAACGVEVAVWRPQDWPAVVQRLKPKQQPSGRRSTVEP